MACSSEGPFRRKRANRRGRWRTTTPV